MTAPTESSADEMDGKIRQLDALFRPKRVAFVGASDKNLFSRRAYTQFLRVAPDAELPLVNPRTEIVHGQQTVKRCVDIPGGIDCAFMLTPADVTVSALDDAADAGARAAVIVSQGWAEEGPVGAVRQEELVAKARSRGMTLLGPNHIGFANLWDRVAPCSLGLELPTTPGHVGLITQSGAIGSSLVTYAARNDVRFSFVITVGNESMVDVSAGIQYLVEDENTRAIAVFAETIRDPQTFREAARCAAEVGKPIIILKVGSSQLAAATAQAHTGALVGDDRVIDAVLRQDGVIRVKTVEDLVCTANLAASTGPLRSSGIGVLSTSGGACDITADLGQDAGLSLPALDDVARARIEKFLPSYGQAQNPLDMTGGALADPEAWKEGLRAFAANQPQLGLLGVVTSLPREGEQQRIDTFRAVGECAAETGLPIAVFPQIDQDQSEYIRTVRDELNVQIVMPGVARFVTAASAIARWSKWLAARSARDPEPLTPQPMAIRPIRAGETLSEYDARALVAPAGVEFVPTVLATDVHEAIGAAEAYSGPVVLKMCSAGAAHKTELGGVALNLHTPAEVMAAFDRLADRADQHGLTLQGQLVSPMRGHSTELLVGVTRDPSWGLILAVAAGGELVEILDDSALRVLPVSRNEISSMLRELRISRILDGYRGRRSADFDSVVDAVAGIAAAAVGLGDKLASLEVNPLAVSEDRVEGLDILITTLADG
ncbi:Acyl-CoA synthetase (NDP forming) [Brevibacterium sandarakinum]|uniref:Acyl-CoA synthetase (NDP forming) n=1 Tax=Brevibacterium sandarakinum TaxID=629680 RepID=A0A1H1SKC3_BRESA|nr:acetate--CoA ligase family protein [Brevibacterium sandarakinum]SDS48288.1 Acyl-CoA synthetase (NDP forming) [Brevibacterium sandarakinum]